jgi:hypothetical protein
VFTSTLLTAAETEEIIAQCNRLDDQDLFGLMVNCFYEAGLEHDVLKLHEAELIKDILGERLGFRAYQKQQ